MLKVAPSLISVPEDFKTVCSNSLLFRDEQFVMNKNFSVRGIAVGFHATDSVRQWIWDRYATFAPPAIQRSVFKRKTEYAFGRLLCAGLLAELDCAPESIWVKSRQDRSPIWPPGFTGSISHTGDMIFAAVAECPEDGSLSIGLDIERKTLSSDAQESLQLCFNSNELALLQVVESGLALGFSAKEALFKCLYPLTKVFFDFLDAEIVEVDMVARQVQIVLKRSLGQFPSPTLLEVTFQSVDEPEIHPHWYTTILYS